MLTQHSIWCNSMIIERGHFTFHTKESNQAKQREKKQPCMSVLCWWAPCGASFGQKRAFLVGAFRSEQRFQLGPQPTQPNKSRVPGYHRFWPNPGRVGMGLQKAGWVKGTPNPWWVGGWVGFPDFFFSPGRLFYSRGGAFFIGE